MHATGDVAQPVMSAARAVLVTWSPELAAEIAAVGTAALSLGARAAQARDAAEHFVGLLGAALRPDCATVRSASLGMTRRHACRRARARPPISQRLLELAHAEAVRLRLLATSGHLAALLEDARAVEREAAAEAAAAARQSRELDAVAARVLRGRAAPLVHAVEACDVAAVSRELGNVRLTASDLARAGVAAELLLRAAESEEGVFDERYKVMAAKATVDALQRQTRDGGSVPGAAMTGAALAIHTLVRAHAARLAAAEAETHASEAAFRLWLGEQMLLRSVDVAQVRRHPLRAAGRRALSPPLAGQTRAQAFAISFELVCMYQLAYGRLHEARSTRRAR